jgi:hypothetical protein
MLPESDRSGGILRLMSRAGAVSYSLPTSTTFELAGMRVVESRGSCFGLVVRSMGLAKSFTAG